ncbi:hypothetical protein JCM16358_22340 [Halanaerocella petrolearia]
MFQNQEGSVIVLTLLTTLVLLTLVTGMLTSLVSEVKINETRKKELQTFYLAEAGLEYARDKFANDSFWKTADKEGQFKLVTERLPIDINKEYKTEITKEITDNQVTFTSLAKYKNNTKRISATYRYQNNNSSQAFNYSVYSGNEIKIKNNATIIGNESGGDLYSTGEINMGNNIYLKSSILKEEESDNLFPEIEIDSLRKKADYLITRDSKDPMLIEDGINYIDGDVEFHKNNIQGSGVLVVDGNLSAKSNWQITQGRKGPFLVIVTGDINIKNNAYLETLLYSQGSIKLWNNVEIVGSLIAQDRIIAKNNLKIVFDNSYLDTFKRQQVDYSSEHESDSEGKLQLVSWQED